MLLPNSVARPTRGVMSAFRDQAAPWGQGPRLCYVPPRRLGLVSGRQPSVFNLIAPGLREPQLGI